VSVYVADIFERSLCGSDNPDRLTRSPLSKKLKKGSIRVQVPLVFPREKKAQFIQQYYKAGEPILLHLLRQETESLGPGPSEHDGQFQLIG
jgi:hypothetical protein